MALAAQTSPQTTCLENVCKQAPLTQWQDTSHDLHVIVTVLAAPTCLTIHAMQLGTIHKHTVTAE